MIYRKTKQANLKTYFLPLSFILILSLICGYLLSNTIEGFFFNQMSAESSRLAKHYTSRLSNGTAANNVITDLLNQKLMAAGHAVVSNEHRIDNDFLEAFAQELDIDAIYWYNPIGETIYSSTGEYIGWQAFEGHPVHDFMVGGTDVLVDDIRPDTESGIHYKYAYYKATDGYFVQVAIFAEKIKDLTNRFSIQFFIDVLEEDKNLIHMHFISNDYEIIASSEESKIGSYIPQTMKASIADNLYHDGRIVQNGTDVFETLFPLYIDDERIGTLAVYYSLENTENLIERVALIGSGIVILAFAVYVLLFMLIIRRNNRLAYLAYYDSLTEMPNKAYLYEYLLDAIQKQPESHRALLMLNCRNFKMINITVGYQNSDSLLKEIARRLLSLDLDDSELFRLSADRFIVCINNYQDKNDLMALCDRILAIFEMPFQLGNTIQFVSGRLGVVEVSNRHTEVERLLKEAQAAINNADEKDIGCCFFSEVMVDNLLIDEAIENNLRQAIDSANDEHQLYLEYQPKIDLKTDKIIGFEALVRLRCKDLGVVPPNKFIHIAEKQQLIVPLGEWVLRTGCKFIKTIEDQGYKKIVGSINISSIQLLQDDFCEVVMNIVKETGINPSNLELEITETILMDNYMIVNEKLSELRQRGIKISIDDFGTGYSSLARIKNLNIDSIKIDKYFIDNLLGTNRNEVLTEFIISLAHRLGLKVIAEGVEEQEQKDYLIQNGCDIIQGYLFSRPVSDENVLKLIKETN